MTTVKKYYDEAYYRESECYRVWIDESGSGAVRILKRVKFRMLVEIFQDLLRELKKVSTKKSHVTLYISRSLKDQMSDNTSEFLEFCRNCVDMDFELIIV